jgi:hypothetical protein
VWDGNVEVSCPTCKETVQYNGIGIACGFWSVGITTIPYLIEGMLFVASKIESSFLAHFSNEYISISLLITSSLSESS